MRRLIVDSRLDRRAAEALMLEIRVLAASCGLQVTRTELLAWAPNESIDPPSDRGSRARDASLVCRNRQRSRVSPSLLRRTTE